MSTSSEQVSQIWIEIESGDLEYAKTVAFENNASVEADEEAGFLDGGSLTILILGGALAVSTVVYLIDKHKGGQLIDLQPGANPMAKRDKGIQYGLVQIIAADGTVRVEVHEPRQLFGQVIDAVKEVALSLVGSSADVVKSAVEAAVGDKAQTTATK